MNDTSPPSVPETAPGPTGFQQVRDSRESALGKYQLLVVGNQRFGSLLLHELLTTLFTYVPGLLGILLRRLFYPLLFRQMERGVVIGSGVSLRQPRRISIARGGMIDDLASLSARGDDPTRIHLGQEVFVGRSSVIGVRNGVIEIGDHSNIGGFCRIACSGGTLRFGRHVLVGAFTYIGGGMHRCERTDIPMALQGQVFKGGVTIEDDVWIGGGCQILDGVTIGKGSIIGAGAIVTKDIPPYSIAFGNPATVRRTRPIGEDSGPSVGTSDQPPPSVPVPASTVGTAG